MSVRLYVEGGGDHNKALQTLCRKGFSEFICKSGLSGRMPRIVACGGRQRAFESFKTAHEHNPSSHPVLLVDSEGEVDAQNPWEHLRDRTSDGWRPPTGASEDQLHLMVQTMEAWFYADPAELKAFYGQHFRLNALSTRAEIEEISKEKLFSELRVATADCPKGEYSKGDHSFQLLARIDPDKVRTASPWCDRFLRVLDQLYT